MSPRAACRLERIGFVQVHDYTAGIADWKAAGLYVEATERQVVSVADAMQVDVPTCDPMETLGPVRNRTFAAGWEENIVLDCDDVVIGRLRNKSWDGHDDVRVETAMESRPTTLRPDGDLVSLVERMGRAGTQLIVVATPQGRLLGVVRYRDASPIVTGLATTHAWYDCDGCPGQRHAQTGSMKSGDGAKWTP